MKLILDTGALVALERNDRSMWAKYTASSHAGLPIVSHGGVVAQVWRNGSRRARLSSALAGIGVIPLDARLGKRTGELLSSSGTSDVVDAAVVAIASDGDVIATSDPGDIRLLAAAADIDVGIIAT